MAEVIVGMPPLQARLRAISAAKMGPELMRKLAAQTVREEKLLVPRKTGNLGRSIHIAEVTATHAKVQASANYAAYVELGTRPHDITPNARKALRWAAKGTAVRLTGTPTKAAQRAGGAWAFAKRVHHPGTRPHPYMVPGAEAAVRKAGLLDVVITAWNSGA